MSEITTAEALAALPADGSRVTFGEILPGYPRRDVREVLAELFTTGRATLLHGEGWGRVLPDETTPGTAGARSTEARPRFDGDPESYTHHAGEPVTDPHGSVVDIDGERFVIGRSTDEHVGTDTFRFPLFSYDYALVSAGARFTPEQMGASIDHVEIVAETKEMDAGSGPAAQYVAVRRLADGRVLVAVGSEDEDTEVWAALDPHSWETIRAL